MPYPAMYRVHHSAESNICSNSVRMPRTFYFGWLISQKGTRISSPAQPWEYLRPAAGIGKCPTESGRFDTIKKYSRTQHYLTMLCCNSACFHDLRWCGDQDPIEPGSPGGQACPHFPDGSHCRRNNKTTCASTSFWGPNPAMTRVFAQEGLKTQRKVLWINIAIFGNNIDLTLHRNTGIAAASLKSILEVQYKRCFPLVT